jgi:hypothetical protein
MKELRCHNSDVHKPTPTAAVKATLDQRSSNLLETALSEMSRTRRTSAKLAHEYTPSLEMTRQWSTISFSSKEHRWK